MGKPPSTKGKASQVAEKHAIGRETHTSGAKARRIFDRLRHD
jgi:hypothetical protein